MTNPTEASAFQLNRRGFLGLGAAAGFVAALSACSPGTASSSTGTTGSKAPAGPAKGEITAAISYQLGTGDYNPLVATGALQLAAIWHVFEGLTDLNAATREIYPALGAELPKKIDDTTYEVKLRDGAEFHDGSKVSVDDVIYSFDAILKNPKNTFNAFISFIEKVEKKDDSTVTLKLKYAFSLVAERIVNVKIVPKALVEKDAKAFGMKPVGSGPYKMTDSGAASQKVVFEAFDKYNGKHAARAKKMTWNIMPDEATRTNALQSGAVQAIDSVPAASLATLASAKKVSAEQGFGLLFMMFNCGSGPMADVKNRQAMLYALDYDKMTKTAMADMATPATSFVQKEHPAYKQAKVTYPGKMEEAKKLLAETGLKKVRLLSLNHGWFAAVRPIVKQSLEAAGLQVEYVEKANKDGYDVIASAPDAYDVFLAPGDPSVFGDDPSLLLSWWYAADIWANGRMHWAGQDSHKKVQSLLEEANKLTGDAQKAKWGELFDVISENVPLYPLFHRKTPTGWDDKTLTGFKPLRVTGLSFIDVGSNK